MCYRQKLITCKRIEIDKTLQNWNCFQILLNLFQKNLQNLNIWLWKMFAFSKTTELGYNWPANNVSMSNYYFVCLVKMPFSLFWAFHLPHEYFHLDNKQPWQLILHYYSSKKPTQISTSKETFYSWTFTFLKENNSLMITRINKCQCS